jgi:hypothetical protein
MPLTMLLLFISFSLVSQQPGYELTASVKVHGEQFYTDAFGNVYVINAGEIKRFDDEYREAARYSNSYLGKISSIDLSDPLRILLFFKAYNQILWLDKYLTEIRSPVMLDQLGYEQVPVVCSSSQGGFWLYNERTCQICYLNNNMEPIYESISLRPMLEPSEQPVSMLEKNRQIYLNIPGKGIFIFDMFANYLKIIPVNGFSRFQVTDTDIFYYNDDHLYKYNMSLDTTITLELPGMSRAVHAEVQPGFLYIFTRDAFQVYKHVAE